jgi:ComF family protein
VSFHAAIEGQCEVCRRWGRAGWCAECESRHAPAALRCARCGLRLGTAAAACGDCLREPPPFERTTVAVDYGFPWDRLVAAFKFHGQVELAASMARLIGERVDAAGAPPPDLVVPMPLARARLAERGFNQAWELARRVASRRRLPARADVLERVLHTTHQAQLTREQRQRNLRNAFVAARGLDGRHVALVDDVMTTGATAREAALALKRAGVARVSLWLFARTPAP